MVYEIEVRFRFHDVSQIWNYLPTLAKLHWRKEIWHTEIYGARLFQAGELLRISKIMAETDNNEKLYLGWKGVDFGQFANIREEINEEVTDGIQRSVILQTLGFSSLKHQSYRSVVSALVAESYSSFMAFSGENEVASDSALHMHFKIMHCEDIAVPLLLEVEKKSRSRKAAVFQEGKLQKFAEENGLLDQIVREEPPTLLFRSHAGKDT